jgi:hypothetical protein
MVNDVTFQPITQTYNAKFEKWIICYAYFHHRPFFKSERGGLLY